MKLQQCARDMVFTAFLTGLFMSLAPMLYTQIAHATSPTTEVFTTAAGDAQLGDVGNSIRGLRQQRNANFRQIRNGRITQAQRRALRKQNRQLRRQIRALTAEKRALQRWHQT